MENVRIDHS